VSGGGLTLIAILCVAGIAATTFVGRWLDRVEREDRQQTQRLIAELRRQEEKNR